MLLEALHGLCCTLSAARGGQAPPPPPLQRAMMHGEAVAGAMQLLAQVREREEGTALQRATWKTAPCQLSQHLECTAREEDF